MTSFAMSDAANWIGIASYGLVALLGLWLVARKLFGWGHSHGDRRRRAPAPAKARAHLHRASRRIEATIHDHAHDTITTGHDACPPRGDARSGQGRLARATRRGAGRRRCGPARGRWWCWSSPCRQGLLAAGIAAVFLMGLGTAITVAILATPGGFGQGAGAAPVPAAMAGWPPGWSGGRNSLGAVLVLAFGVVLLLASSEPGATPGPSCVERRGA